MSARHLACAFRILVPAIVTMCLGGCPRPPTQQTAAPVFTPDGGTFENTVSVAISSATEGAAIFYTTDGTIPSDTNGTAYTNEFTLTQTTTLKAIAFADGFLPSPVSIATFTITQAQGRTTPPVISNASVTGILAAGHVGAVTVSATVTDSDSSVVSVTADLTSIGGQAAQALERGAGNEWSWSGNVSPTSEGTKTITFTAVDDSDTSATATATIDVAPSNAVPTLSDASVMGFLFVDEPRPLHLSVIAEDSDGTVVSVVADLSAVGGSDAQELTKGQNNQWTASVEVTATATGPQTITFTATDDRNDTAEEMVTVNVADARPAAGTLKEAFFLGDTINAAPALGEDGTVYIVSYNTGILYAIDADGNELWLFECFDAVRRSATVAPDGTIYISCLGGKVQAVNPDGTDAGAIELGEGLVAAPAIGSDGTVYVGSVDGVFRALNPNGTEAWSFTAGNGFHAEAAIGADGTIYVGSLDLRLYALNPDGSLKWDYRTEGQIQGAPAIGADGTIYIGSDDGNLHAIAADGTPRWTFMTAGPVRAAPSIAPDGTIYAGSLDGSLYAINPNGTEQWEYATAGEVWSTPAIGSDGIIYFGSDDNVLYSLNPDGSENWTFTMAVGELSSSPVISPDGTLYIGSWDGHLYSVYVSGELADSPWPMFQHDPLHTGDVRTP